MRLLVSCSHLGGQTEINKLFLFEFLASSINMSLGFQRIGCGTMLLSVPYVKEVVFFHSFLSVNGLIRQYFR